MEHLKQAFKEVTAAEVLNAGWRPPPTTNKADANLINEVP